jgi:DNA repair protein RadC
MAVLSEMPLQEQPRERLIQFGPAALSSMELLAITLRSGAGGNGAIGLAQRVLEEMNGLPGLARATASELTQVEGIGPVRAVTVKAALELGRRALAVVPTERPRVTSPAEAAHILIPEMMHLEQEHLKVMLLNTRNVVLRTPTIYIGSLNTSVIRVGEVFRAAIRENAAALIVAHNHPSGDPTPSPEDVRVTRELARAGELLGIDVLDHIVIGDQRFVSLKECGLGFE